MNYLFGLHGKRWCIRFQCVFEHETWFFEWILATFAVFNKILRDFCDFSLNEAKPLVERVL